VYPELALRTRTSATVILDMEIDAKGRVVKATPASGPSIFHNAAITAAMKWRYKPASVGGVNVPSQSRVTMVFNLNK
jgi:protein TonB